jgi:hypothetical protein
LAGVGPWKAVVTKAALTLQIPGTDLVIGKRAKADLFARAGWVGVAEESVAAALVVGAGQAHTALHIAASKSVYDEAVKALVVVALDIARAGGSLDATRNAEVKDGVTREVLLALHNDVAALG